MTIAYFIRAGLAVIDSCLFVTIVATIAARRHITDFWQDWRFIALGCWCLVPIVAVKDRLHAPLTWGVWMAVVATAASCVGIWGIRRQQNRR